MYYLYSRELNYSPFFQNLYTVILSNTRLKNDKIVLKLPFLKITKYVSYNRLNVVLRFICNNISKFMFSLTVSVWEQACDMIQKGSCFLLSYSLLFLKTLFWKKNVTSNMFLAWFFLHFKKLILTARCVHRLEFRRSMVPIFQIRNFTCNI